MNCYLSKRRRLVQHQQRPMVMVKVKVKDDNDAADDDHIDRISQLPEPLLHTILSRLSDDGCNKDVVRTSVLSKRWRWYWASLPNLHLNEQHVAPLLFGVHVTSTTDKEGVQSILDKRERFANFVDHVVSHRHRSNIRTHKFRVDITFPCKLSLIARMDQWIRYAVESDVEELHLNLRSGFEKIFRYKLPEVLFATRTMATLHLQFCRFEPNGDIRLPLLQKLHLYEVHIGDGTFQTLLSSCSRIEYLCMMYCEGFENLVVSSPKLDTMTVTLNPSYKIGKFEIRAPYLQCLDITYGDQLPSDINLTSCNNLKKVVLGSIFGVTDRFVRELLSNLSHLENLSLSECHMLEHIEVSSHHLKVLKLNSCPKLFDIKIDAPNLLCFEFKGSYKTSILLMKNSNPLEVKLAFPDGKWYSEYIRMSKKFDHAGVLTLVFFRTVIDFPLHVREQVIPLLYNVKHLNLIRARTLDFITLVDVFLRICPGVEKISFTSDPDSNYLEFAYGERMDGDKDQCSCRYHPRRCERHLLRAVKIVNFGDHEVAMELEKFFIRNVRTVEMIPVLG